MDVITVLVCGLVPTLITLWLNEKVKGSVQNSFSKKLEEVKKEHSKELSQFQSELNYLKSKESFKFTKLHEKRFEVMAKTYKYLNDALFKLRIYVSPLKGALNNETNVETNHKQFTDYTEADKKLYEYYSFNKIYFNDEIEELLEKYFTSSLDILNQYVKNEFVNRDGVLFDSKVYMSAATAYKKIPELIEPIQLEIKNKFRELLGE
ncbi:hypothetical protein [Flavobacterium sp. T12S277]|uniref:hypothetical protein n=1 Tax=Flavobacterium sp. T12S277 TaxID=3402752 RepID=UPI003AEAE653